MVYGRRRKLRYAVRDFSARFDGRFLCRHGSNVSLGSDDTLLNKTRSHPIGCDHGYAPQGRQHDLESPNTGNSVLVLVAATSSRHDTKGGCIVDGLAGFHA